MKSIDINCDMGEGLGEISMVDQQIMPLVTSSNVACGFHAGDALQMEETIKLAVKHEVQVGAHPGYPDKEGFGRIKMDLPPDELTAIVKNQLDTIMGVAESLKTTITYVKLHGALYNQAAAQEHIALGCLRAITAINAKLKIVGPADSALEKLCMAQGLTFIAEAFADRMYESNGKLRSRSLPGAVITDPIIACKQALDIVKHQRATAFDGTKIVLRADTLCIHGDNPAAIEILSALDRAFKQHGIVKKSF